MEQNPILQLLEETERRRAAALDRIEKAKREIEMIDVERVAYRRALEAMGVSVTEPQREVRWRFTDLAPAVRGPDSFSEKWLDLFAVMARRNPDGPYDYDDVEWAAKEVGNEVKKAALRTQMKYATDAGIFNRLMPGQFKLTEEGFKIISERIARWNEKGSPEGDPEAGEAPTSPKPGTGANLFE